MWCGFVDQPFVSAFWLDSLVHQCDNASCYDLFFSGLSLWHISVACLCNLYLCPYSLTCLCDLSPWRISVAFLCDPSVACFFLLSLWCVSVPLIWISANFIWDLCLRGFSVAWLCGFVFVAGLCDVFLLTCLCDLSLMHFTVVYFLLCLDSVTRLYACSCASIVRPDCKQYHI